MKAGHKPGSVHHSAKGGGWLSIWDHRCRWPRAARSGGTGQMTSRRSLALLPAGVYRASTSRCCWCALTAPLHPCHTKVLGGMFLWHYPHGYPHWELPSKPDHVGARTFLKKVLFCFQNKTFLRLPLLLSFSIMLITLKIIYWGCSSVG